MKNKLLKTLAVAAIGLMPLNNTHAAEIHGNVKYIESERKELSYIQNNNFYNLPLGIKGYTFFELYKDKGYYGKTSLERAITDNVNIKGQVIHTNNPVSKEGIGISAKLPTKKFNFKASYLPFWVDKSGKHIDREIAGYSFGTNLPLGAKLEAFGEWDISKSAQWCYGEIELSKNFGDLRLSYNPALRAREKGGAIPKLEHRISVGVNF